jgi:hypothetical protein
MQPATGTFASPARLMRLRPLSRNDHQRLLKAALLLLRLRHAVTVLCTYPFLAEERTVG